MSPETEFLAARSTFCWNDDESITIALDDHEVNLKHEAELVMLWELLKHPDHAMSPRDLSNAAGWTDRHEGPGTNLAEFMVEGEVTGLQLDVNERRIAARVSTGIQAAIARIAKANGPVGRYFERTIHGTGDGCWRYADRLEWTKSPDSVVALFFDDRPTMHRQSGGSWVIEWRGDRHTVGDVVGLHYIALLLQRPGCPIPAARLRQEGIAGNSLQVATEDEVLEASIPVKLLEDARGIFSKENSTRLEQIEARREGYCDESEQDEYHNFDGMTIEEMLQILQEKQKATRASATEAMRRKNMPLFKSVGFEVIAIERVIAGLEAVRESRRDYQAFTNQTRSAVTKAIGSAIARVREADYDLGDYLKEHITTGAECMFDPKTTT